jgi:hypothetical protein
MADIIMDALRSPHKARPKGEWVGGEVTRQYVCSLTPYLCTNAGADSGSSR